MAPRVKYLVLPAGNGEREGLVMLEGISLGCDFRPIRVPETELTQLNSMPAVLMSLWGSGELPHPSWRWHMIVPRVMELLIDDCTPSWCESVKRAHKCLAELEQTEVAAYWALSMAIWEDRLDGFDPVMDSMNYISSTLRLSCETAFDMVMRNRAYAGEVDE